MDVSAKDFESFEQQVKELISEFQTLSTSESHLRNTLRAEAARAEAAEAARDAAIRASAESQASAAAATAGATQATRALAAAQDECITVKMQLELADRQRSLFEENCTEISNKLNAAERELQQLRPLQSAQTTLQQQYIELHQQIQSASTAAQKGFPNHDEAKSVFVYDAGTGCLVPAASEASRLESELRVVERSAGAGAAVRERARLAAAAHARERRLNTDELKHTTRELRAANAEVARLTTVIVELQCKLSKYEEKTSKKTENTEEVLAELKAALEAERTGSARLEKTLASALADNAALAVQLNNKDNDIQERNRSHDNSPFRDICPIDSFLAE